MLVGRRMIHIPKRGCTFLLKGTYSCLRLAAENGVVSVYLHAGPAPGLGRMGALLAIESKGPPLEGAARSSVEELGRHLAMHAVAMKPPYLDRTSGALNVVVWRLY